MTALGGDLHLEGSVKTTKLKLTWLPKVCPPSPAAPRVTNRDIRRVLCRGRHDIAAD